MNDPYPTLPPTPIDVDRIAAEQPQRIGRYKIERVLGEGGFDQVWLAHKDQLNRPVTIKLLHSHRVSRPEDVAANLAEARPLASLDDHSNNVQVLDVVSTEDHPCHVVFPPRGVSK